MYQDNKNGGYSLLELMIVLGLSSFLIAIGTGIHHHLLVKAEVNQFKQQLEQDLLYLQQYTRFDRTAKLYLEKEKYEIYSGKLQEDVLVRKIPDGYAIKISPEAMSFAFSQSGTVLNPGSLTLYTPTGTEKLVFQLGKGRGRYESSS
ncbi:prepilin-type N-terminal cleavage/methylation domain-containing protein [Terribacillus sp. 179-K 1B1 HS]|uniref:prepilin-type N-terminal cleavage/methylation domain-containing protein n=1 Tax=Terribacillus sp. 179-K 1B1 HS TaxID=3142388 RepID=UPI0039A2E956